MLVAQTSQNREKGRLQQNFDALVPSLSSKEAWRSITSAVTEVAKARIVSIEIWDVIIPDFEIIKYRV